MDAITYSALGRQSGLMREMQVVANNIANISTTGFRREGVVFAEHIDRLEDAPSLSMARAVGRQIDLSQAGLTETGSPWDFAIQGEGFFLIDTPGGQRLTRAGSFTPNAEGELVTPDGYRLLDEAGAPVFIPPDAKAVGLARDGTLSSDGAPLGRIGMWQATDPKTLLHQAGTMYSTSGGVEPSEGAAVFQGFLEDSNVNPVAEVARMIEVQRAYEMGQKLLDRDDERVRSVIQTLGR